MASDTFLWLGAVRFDEISGWTNDRQSEALPVFLKSCEKLKTLPPKQKLEPQWEPHRVADWLSICAAAGRVQAGNEIEAQYFFESHFTPYLARNNHLGYHASIVNPHYWEIDQLYDLQNDPEENINVYDKYPKVSSEMKRLLSKHLDSFPERPFGEFTAFSEPGYKVERMPEMNILIQETT